MDHARLQRLLADHTGRPVSVTLTRNIRRWVSVSRRNGAISVRLHEALLAAPERVITALIGFIAQGGTERGRTIRDYLRDHLTHPQVSPRLPVLRPAGAHHHLGVLLDQVCQHFSGPPPAITWGPRRRPGLRRVRLGSYDPKRRMIRVNPVLDHPAVPVAMVRYVIFHEMVHHLLEHDRDRSEPMHGGRFRAEEARCPDLAEARAWEKRHLSGHLARCRGEGPR